MSSLVATAFFASVSPSFSQVFPDDIVGHSAQATAAETRRAVRLERKRAAQGFAAERGGIAVSVPNSPSGAVAAERPYAALIASHAAANGVPPELVHRVVMRESRYRAGVVGRGGATGLMQIKVATARSMGYAGSAAGLLDPETNLTYGVRYLAGAYRAAGGSHSRAVGYYASGYHGAARRARVYAIAPQPSLFSGAPAMTEALAMEPVAVRRVRRHRR